MPIRQSAVEAAEQECAPGAVGAIAKVARAVVAVVILFP